MDRDREGAAHDRRRAIRVCVACHEEHLHEAKGLCARCYNRRRKTPAPKRLHYSTEGFAIKAAIGVLLPIPAQTRCPGCKDVPACPRAVLPGTGYCLRCGPLARVAA